jgi:hypothetical protein
MPGSDRKCLRVDSGRFRFGIMTVPLGSVRRDDADTVAIAAEVGGT